VTFLRAQEKPRSKKSEKPKAKQERKAKSQKPNKHRKGKIQNPRQITRLVREGLCTLLLLPFYIFLLTVVWPLAFRFCIFPANEEISHTRGGHLKKMVALWGKKRYFLVVYERKVPAQGPSD
jgi:hypothetical protein